MRKKKPTLENPIVQHRQTDTVECPGCGEEHSDGHFDTCACDHCGRGSDKKEELKVEPLPEATVYIKKPNQVLVPQVPVTGTGSAAWDGLAIKKRDLELVAPEQAPVLLPASECPYVDASPFVAAEKERPLEPQFAIIVSDHEARLYPTEQRAMEEATALVAPGGGGLTIYKLTPWRIIRLETKTRIEPAQKRKRKA